MVSAKLSMQTYFQDLADSLGKKLAGGEAYTAWLAGETSDFCRFNHAKIRQAGAVTQDLLSLRLIKGKRNVEGTVTLARDAAEDGRRIDALLATLREQLQVVPEDPYLLYATEVKSSVRKEEDRLPDARETVAAVAKAASGLDLVGIYAAGVVYRGFANSFGQRNWFETASFNLDWSFYERADKAVKTAYAGFKWDQGAFGTKLESAKSQLEVLKREARTVKPGAYPVYLSPSALHEITDMLCWGGFGMKSHKTKQTPLIKMVEAGAKLHPSVTVKENTAGGIAPDFGTDGFVKPPSVTLIDKGSYKDPLISARSAKEYGVETNGASDGESPSSLEMAAGDVPVAEAAKRLGDGVYLNNLWYLNFSDRTACRMTGMTRFASFWVEGGEIVAPLSVMRFDESIYRVLGSELIGLTKEREMMLSASTYGSRSTGSVHLPGALVREFTFTL
jgi:predicted Zn-dependent protease